MNGNTTSSTGKCGLDTAKVVAFAILRKNSTSTGAGEREKMEDG